MRRVLLIALIVLLAPLTGEAKDKPKKKPSGKAIGEAVEKGADWLLKRFKDGFRNDRESDTPELVLLTLSHAGVSAKEPVFQAALKAVLESKLEFTYRVATQAMALSKINPWLHRARLAHCAQWLVETQLPGGEWGYPGAPRTPGYTKVNPPVTEAQAKGGPKAEIIKIARYGGTSEAFTGKGDFSNTQFALLGLRACTEARIQIDKEVWDAALKYQVKYQQEDGSWGYVIGGEQDMLGYASLTCAGAAGVAICAHGMKKGSPKSHPAVKRALSWLKKNWTPSSNRFAEESSIIAPSSWQYYHLYSVERAGQILGLKKIGKRDWYAEGAHWLLAQQKGDGSWQETTSAGEFTARYLHTSDTCFAILFLTLATPPLTR